MSAFLNPHLLWGLLLVGAPIIIHLLNKRRFEVHPWAAMEFLLQAEVRNRRRVQLQDLLLLLLRAAVVAAAVFLVARPVVQGFAGKAEAVRTIVLDDSFSMEHRSAGQSALERAREKAAFEVQEAIAAGARVSVRRGVRPAEEIGSVRGPVEGGQVVSGDAPAAAPGAPAAASPPTDEDPARSGLRLLGAVRVQKASDGALRLAEALEAEARAVEEDHGRELRALVLVSDFRRADWLERSGALLPRVRDALKKLEQVGKERVRLSFIDVGEPSRENCAVIRLGVDAAQPVAGVPVTISVEVKNFGSEERRGLAGELEVGDPHDPTQRIPLPVFPPIPPGGSAAVEIEHAFPAAGEYPLSVKVDEDRLPRDDRASAVAVVRDALSVLVVDGDPGPDRLSGESGFLAAALAPRGGIPTGIKPEVVRGSVTQEMLKGRDVVFLLNAPEVTGEERAALERFVESGGGLVVFLGNRVRAERYEEVLGASRILPARLRKTVEAPGGARLDFGKLEHPALALYKGLRDSSLERITAARYYDVAAAEGAQVVASYADGARTPAVVEGTLGRGRTVLFNISADRDWTDWPTDPSYPVVLQEWVRYLAPRRGEARAVRVGEAISWAAEGAPQELSGPDGGRLEATVAEKTARFDKTDLAGLYRIGGPGPAPAAASAAGAPRWFAVNRPIEESDLTPATEAELRSALSGVGLSISFQKGPAAPEEDRREGDIWRWLAMSAGLLLLSELLCAYWFGRK